MSRLATEPDLRPTAIVGEREVPLLDRVAVVAGEIRTLSDEEFPLDLHHLRSCPSTRSPNLGPSAPIREARRTPRRDAVGRLAPSRNPAARDEMKAAGAQRASVRAPTQGGLALSGSGPSIVAFG